MKTFDELLDLYAAIQALQPAGYKQISPPPLVSPQVGCFSCFGDLFWGVFLDFGYV